MTTSVLIHVPKNFYYNKKFTILMFFVNFLLWKGGGGFDVKLLVAKVIRQNISSLHYPIFDKICKYINTFHLKMILSLFTKHFIDFAQNTSPTER